MYDRAFFDRPIDRRGTACEKWDVAMARDARVSNPMWVADMDFRCPDEVVNALCERAAHPVYGYTGQGVSSDAGFHGAPPWAQADPLGTDYAALCGFRAEGGGTGLYAAWRPHHRAAAGIWTVLRVRAR